jgi:hypothetical protein
MMRGKSLPVRDIYAPYPGSVLTSKVSAYPIRRTKAMPE